MPEAKVGKRGTLVIPAKVRRKVGLKDGDKVKVFVEGSGRLGIERIPSLSQVQERLAGKLSQWKELEGKADELVVEEINE